MNTNIGAHMTTPAAPAPVPVAASGPGKTLGIVGLILAFIAPPLGLILSIVAKVQSRGAGIKNTPATVGIVISILAIVAYIAVIVTVVAGLAAGCAQYGPGVHTLDNGTTLTCGS